MGWKNEYFKRLLYLILILISTAYGHHSDEAKPTSYNLTLTVNSTTGAYLGLVTMKIRTVKEIQKELVLHCVGMEIQGVNLSLVREENREMRFESTYEIKGRDKLVVKMINDQWYPGDYSIAVRYSVTLDSNPQGFFKTACLPNSQNSWIGGSLLEPVNARRLMPSLDVYEGKTPVNITLQVEKNLQVVPSQVVSGQSNDSLQLHHLYFGNVSLDQVGWIMFPRTMQNSDQAGHRVLSCNADSKLTAMNDTVDSYVDMKLTTIQWVAVPNLDTRIASSSDISYVREELLEISNSTSVSDQMEMQASLTEATAQQWFGQRIRPDSWSHLWLTKGLTNFLRYKLAGKVGTLLSGESLLAGSVLPRVLESDSLQKTSPLSQHFHSRRDVIKLYDQDLLDKAGLIMRMIETVIGEKNFMNGVQTFLNQTLATGNMTDDQLLSLFFESMISFETAKLVWSNKTLAEIVESWTRSRGYPILKADRRNNKIVVTQASVLKNTKRWWVPIFLSSQSNSSETLYWLSPKQSSVELTIPANDKWFIINAKGKGYYRVNYHSENWQQLRQAIDRGELSPRARGRLLDDSLALAELGLLNYNIALGFTRHLANESTETEPWAASIRHLVRIRNTIRPNSKAPWDTYVKSLMTGYISGKNTSSDEEGTLTMSEMNSTTFYKLLSVRPICRSNPFCSNVTRNVQLVDMSGVNTNSYTYGDMLDGILCYKIASNNVSLWEQWLSVYSETQSPTLRRKALEALTCSSNQTLLTRYMTMALTLPRQDGIGIITGIASTEEGAQFIMNILVNLIPGLLKIDPLIISTVMKPLTESIYNTIERNQMNQVIASMKESGLFDDDNFNWYQVERGMERMEDNIDRRNKWSDTILAWLHTKDNSPNTDFVLSGSSRTSGLIVPLLMFVAFLPQFLL